MFTKLTRVLLTIGTVVLLAACSSPPVADAVESIAASTARPTPEPTQKPTPEPTPEPTAEPMDPSVALQLFKGVIESNLTDEMRNSLADAIESDFYWIESVDRLTYAPELHAYLVEATVDYESVYMNDPQEWRDDTWTLYQSWSSNIWGSFVDGWYEEGGVDGFTPDWATWTPALVLSGNAGRLTAECPGDLIYRVSQRDATQAEFHSECSFLP